MCSYSWWPFWPSEGDQEMQTLDLDWLWNQLPCRSGSKFLKKFVWIYNRTIYCFKEEHNERMRCLLLMCLLYIVQFHYKALWKTLFWLAKSDIELSHFWDCKLTGKLYIRLLSVARYQNSNWRTSARGLLQWPADCTFSLTWAHDHSIISVFLCRHVRSLKSWLSFLLWSSWPVIS